ncbi:hypothetical protein [Aeromonas veronii]|uniref:hypothetical protein n=1 Tax=Aeromonas veronii TaxID=654 RepID=UPI0011168EBF|nr:hypothetical protein [Aeromonas veronii]
MKKILIWFGTISGILSIASFSIYRFNLFILDTFKLSVTNDSLPLIFLLSSGFAFSLLYLQGGDGIITTTLKIKEDFDNAESLIELKKKVDELSSKVEGNSFNNAQFELNKDDIKNEILNKVTQENISLIFNSEAEKLKSALENEIKYEKLYSSSKSIKTRLYREISDLRLRANMNLVIGIAITALGLAVLYQTVGFAEKMHEIQPQTLYGTANTPLFKELFLSFAPRIMLVIFIEMFAYFFLRLYKQGLSEIKYFQNELTNIESKVIALEVCYLNDDNQAMTTVIDALSKTERNFVLEKDQTTIEIEKSKLDTETTKGLMSMLQNLIKK